MENVLGLLNQQGLLPGTGALHLWERWLFQLWTTWHVSCLQLIDLEFVGQVVAERPSPIELV